MSDSTALIAIGVISLIVVYTQFILPRRALAIFWKRDCTGKLWRRRFPYAPKADIREFLTIFVEAFCFAPKRRTCFSPDDRVMDVYRAEYAGGALADFMELERFGVVMGERYGIVFESLWREDITLGELFSSTRLQADSDPASQR